MKNSDIIIASFFIIESIIIGYFFYIYLKNEKKNKANSENQFKELQNLILNKIIETEKQQDLRNTQNTKNQENRLNDTSKKLIDKITELAINIKTAHEQSNSKAELGIELIINENKKNQKELNIETNLIKNSFKDYSKIIETTIIKYTEDNHDTKLDANKFKEEIQHNLKSILMEIKAPLDLD